MCRGRGAWPATPSACGISARAHPANQRQGGTLHSDAASGVGVRRTVRLLADPSNEAPALFALLQSPATARQPGLRGTVVAAYERCVTTCLNSTPSTMSAPASPDRATWRHMPTLVLVQVRRSQTPPQ